MKHLVKLAAAGCALSVLGLTACGSSPASKTSTSGATLTMESSPTGPLTRTFNPYSSSSAGAVLGLTDMINEPLLQFDLLKPGTVYPWLATSYAWSQGGKTITFDLRSGVKFTNGAPFNGADVAFVFNMIKKNAAINSGGLQITSATAPNATTAVINFAASSYALLYYIAGTVMVPENVWSKVADPATFADPDPIGTGPYQLSTFSTQGVLLTKNPNYWQAGEPHVAKLDFPAYDSNTSANLALEQGSLDWGGNFVSNIKAAFLAKSPANHYWDAPLQTETLIPNLTTFPFSSLAVRQAVAVGVNRTVISDDGEDFQQPPATEPGSLTGLTLPNDASYLTPATSTYTTSFNTAKAKAILKAAGWKMGSKGYFVSPSGKTLAFTFQDPSAYTDFIADDQIMASELKAAGMDVTVQGVSVNAWNANLASGNFQATSHWGSGGPSPYYLYNNYLNYALSAPIGKTASGDYERFNSSQANAYLAEYAGSDSATVQKTAIVGLEKLVATQLPVIPLFYGVAWDEYNSSKFTGWPGPTNEYAPGEPSGPFNEITVLRLRPVS